MILEKFKGQGEILEVQSIYQSAISSRCLSFHMVFRRVANYNMV